MTQQKYVHQGIIFLMVESGPTDMNLIYFSPNWKNLIVAQTMITRIHLVPLPL